MKINKNLEKRIDGLFKKYPLFSREENLISKVRFWIVQASTSLIPDSPLAVAEGNIDCYEMNKSKGRLDNYLIGELRKIVEDAYNIYYDKIVGVVARK